jgi:alcohol dehydrogenase
MSSVSKDDFFLYLNGKKKCKKKLFKIVAIPTTSGTGAEATPFATVWDDQNKKKMSLSSPLIYPDYALVDPALTVTLNLRTTAITALDALSHSFESLWNINSNLYTDALSISNIETILNNLLKLLHNLSNLDLRLKLSWSSYIAGICISITKTALAHSISYPLTSHLKIPHGLASGIFLPEILKFNNKHDKSGSMDKVSNILISGVPVEKKLNNLYSELHRFGIFDEILEHKSNIYSLIPEMENPSRSKNNIVEINSNRLKFIIDSFYEKY